MIVKIEIIKRTDECHFIFQLHFDVNVNLIILTTNIDFQLWHPKFCCFPAAEYKPSFVFGTKYCYSEWVNTSVVFNISVVFATIGCLLLIPTL